MNDYETFCSIKSKNERINQKNYQHKIDKLMYIVIHIRSNIFFAIKRFNQYFNDFAKYYDHILKILFKYIRFIINFDIIYDEKLNNNENIMFKFETFSNLNYVVNKFNKKSIFDYVYMFEKKSIA